MPVKGLRSRVCDSFSSLPVALFWFDFLRGVLYREVTWLCDRSYGNWTQVLNCLGPSYLKDHISLYEPVGLIRGGLYLSPTTFMGVLGGDTGEGLLCCCSQTLALPPTGS